MDTQTLDLNIFSDEEEDIEDMVSSLKENDFIQVQFLYNKNTKRSTIKQFVCQVKKHNKGHQRCVSTLQLHERIHTFIFPDVEYLWDVTTENVVKKLQIVQEKRGKYNFNTLLQ